MSERENKALAIGTLYEAVNGKPFEYNKTPVTQNSMHLFSKQDINQIIKTAIKYEFVALKSKYAEKLKKCKCITVFEGYTLEQFRSAGLIRKYKLLYAKQLINFVLLGNTIYFPVTNMSVEYLVCAALDVDVEDTREWMTSFLCECENILRDPIEYALNIAKARYK